MIWATAPEIKKQERHAEAAEEEIELHQEITLLLILYMPFPFCHVWHGTVEKKYTQNGQYPEPVEVSKSFCRFHYQVLMQTYPPPSAKGNIFDHRTIPGGE